ncbi:MAG: hypothetical protein MJE68_18915 [Proteobacteria bacterium]|nr:hypothetical protein [Pseudomonadota bacterium]
MFYLQKEKVKLKEDFVANLQQRENIHVVKIETLEKCIEEEVSVEYLLKVTPVEFGSFLLCAIMYPKITY